MNFFKLFSILFLTYISSSQAFNYVDKKFISPNDFPAKIQDISELKSEDDKSFRTQNLASNKILESAISQNYFKVEMMFEELGLNLQDKQKTQLVKFLNKVLYDAKNIYHFHKNFWKQKRPYQVSDKVKLFGEETKSYSYPSGHSTKGYLISYILADIFPEYESYFQNKSAEVAINRVYLGLHYHKDIETGKLLAEKIYEKLNKNKEYIEDLKEVKNAINQ